MQIPNDEELMTAVRTGEVRKLAVLFDRHNAAVFRYAMRMTGNRARSEDLVQEVFVRILKYRDTFRDDSPFVTWMYRIARNAYVDHTRKHKREVQSEQTPDLPVAPIHELEQEQDLKLLRQAMERLPEAQRELLALARFQQMPYDQIAEILDVETGTVKTRVHRAIKQLRDIYFDLTRTPYALRTGS